PALASAQGRLYTLDETVALIGEAAGAQGSFRWDPFLQEGSFAARGHHGVFSAALFPGESGFLMLNNRDVHNVPLPFFQGGSLVFPAAFVETAQDAFARLARGNDSFHYRIAAIIIDPGHGGRDPGAVFNHVINGVSRQVRESDITLRASIMLRDALRRSFPDKLVLTTRERDVYLSLADRTAIANSVPTRDDEGIIFISIHANYATNRSARGFEVWHLPPNYTRGLEMVNEDEFPDPDLRRILNMLTEDWFHAESTMIAQSILSGLQASVGSRMPNRGLRAENWFVVSRSNMPAVLVELGFISNAQDAAMLTNDAELRRIVDGVHGGIVNFVEAFERSGGFLIAQ
ncbi:MAG: N-acetylmuramoyl-L-alanine amidase, partial [Treponema sp.]|nr:N-acetylmuramoyl-L-alanine amidase [Treponema sp.]